MLATTSDNHTSSYLIIPPHTFISYPVGSFHWQCQFSGSFIINLSSISSAFTLDHHNPAMLRHHQQHGHL